VLISIVAVLMFRRAPWLLVGWFWFLGTLVPVIGIVQVGGQALADRYTYLPSIGLLIVAIWSLASLVKAPAAGDTIIKVAAPIAILACMVQTHAQLGYWKNNLTVFEHALAVTRNNSVAHTMVGIENGERGDFQAAISHFQQAIQTTPGDADGYFHLGYTYELLGKRDQALQQYLIALQLRPWDATFHYVLGKLLWSQGKKEETLQHFRKAIEINPDYFDALYALGAALDEMNASKDAIPYLKHAVGLRPKSREALLKIAEALMNAGRLSEAEMRFEQLVAMAPDNPENHINLGGILWVRGKWSEALLAYSQAVRLKPDWSVARYDLGTALMSQKRFEEAAQEFGEAARLNTNYAQAITGWGRALAAQGKTNEAVAKFEESFRIKADAFPLYQLAMVCLSQRKDSEAIDYLKRALELRPDWPIGLKELAWLRATASESDLRNGAEAVRLAERACQLTSNGDPACLNSLAAAYAETGKFDEAASTAEKALGLTYRGGQPELAAILAEAVKLYRDHKPFRR
jgi:tetratricopeptide (TPR) repeat protein